MKKSLKKLALSRETVRNLDIQNLADIAGGVTNANSCTNETLWKSCVETNCACQVTQGAGCTYTSGC